MQPFPHHEDRSPKPFVERLDRACAEINAFLLALAIGLAVLDIACFTAISSIAAIKPLLQTAQTAPVSGRVIVAAGDAPGR